ncbi:hypothetical protein TraAM80_09682 [Trypanosoma rangeli]|uniref:Uncharacterized protein n=1 Tax=Trypanosoma rangeli TaxID=5698 RepID=A0A422MU26_TRYRA|nr:uncharacterized protein TraAM80_09682 [Trypanosoma rangeli]RNE96681.1 hypothetical protein TraAM80_09682 [Trypanosoma rangeli]|eukprot:RNE96681.1 hypothetical protein TraAM80_09682 [Trypanosoma rangeli]
MRVGGGARNNGPLLLNASAVLRASMRCLSLSELAKVFAEINEPSTVPVPTGAPASAGGVQRELAACTQSGTLPVGVRELNRLFGAKGSGLKNTRSVLDSGVITFAPAYSKSLSGISASQLALVLEKECKQQHLGHMMQCLAEVCRRLREASLMGVVITDKEACGEVGGDSLAVYLFRSDEILESVLRLLAKTNLDEVQQSHRLFWELRDEGVSADWVTELGCLLIQWLTARAALLSPVCSATFLHLIAQQKVFHSDAVLETLRDNIEVHFAKGAVTHTQSASSAVFSSHRVSADNDVEFDVSVFAMLLDAMARWQLGHVRFLGTDTAVLQNRLHGGNNVMATITQLQHPILSSDFYNVVVGRLLLGVRDGSLHLTRHRSPSTFFFLALALAKIRWFRPDCAEVLLPQLHEALRVFPGQYLGVVLLLGRREVKVCSVATTELLLQTVLDTMQKRGQRYIPADGRNRHSPDGVALTTSVVTAQSTDASSRILACCGHEGDASVAMTTLDINADEDDLQLFSASSYVDSVCDKDIMKVPEDEAVASAASSQVSSAAFTTSFMDLRSVPIFIESLNHILTITLEHCRAQGKEAELHALNAKAETLYEALLNDTHRGVKSLHTLQESPALSEKLLSAVLRTPRKTHHPLLIELAYVFTRHVAARRAASKNGSKGTAVAPHWQWRTLTLVDLLVQRGVILPETYFMTDEVIQLAPRVLSAVEAEKGRLLERQRRHEKQDGWKKKKTVRTSAVFVKFSRTVAQMKQQM